MMEKARTVPPQGQLSHRLKSNCAIGLGQWE
jgi:hypothetical protein